MVKEIDSYIRHILRLADKEGVRIRQMAIGGTSAGGQVIVEQLNSRYSLVKTTT